MKPLIRACDIRRLRYNHTLADKNKKHIKPPVRLFNKIGKGNWLLIELNNNDSFYAIVDLGIGNPEMCEIAMEEFEIQNLPDGFEIEQDIEFETNKTIKEILEESKKFKQLIL